MIVFVSCPDHTHRLFVIDVRRHSFTKVLATTCQVRDDSWDFKSDGVDGWDTRSGSSVSRSQDLDKFPSGRLPSVGEAAHRVDTSAADKRIFTKVRG
jgi:hypothetical protein